VNGFNSVSAIATAAAWSYGLALAGYLAFAIRVGLGWSRSLRAALLLAATLATALWAGAGLLIALQDSPSAWLLAKSADALRYGIWFAFVWSLLEGARRADAQPGLPTLFPRWAVALVAAALLARVALSEELPLAQALGQDRRVELGLDLGFAICGLILVEQLIRRAHAQSRWSIKPLCIALGGVFGFDLFCYADAMLFSRIDPQIWAARGIANAMVIPFIAVATARNTGWKVEMHFSRQVVFQSTASGPGRCRSSCCLPRCSRQCWWPHRDDSGPSSGCSSANTFFPTATTIAPSGCASAGRSPGKTRLRDFRSA